MNILLVIAVGIAFTAFAAIVMGLIGGLIALVLFILLLSAILAPLGLAA